MKKLQSIAFIVLFFAIVFTIFSRSSSSWTVNPAVSGGMSASSSSPKAETIAAKIPQVKIRSAVIPVELAQTAAEIQKGLSGRISLEKNKGMLFIFPKPAIYQFWMPNMRFPIDIIWIHEGKIVDISAKVSNDFDPAKPRFYTSSKPVRYVLEVNAEFAARNGMKIGDAVIFQNIGT